MFGKRKRANELGIELFEYFKIEKTDGELVVRGEFKNKDFTDWLYFIHNQIQIVLDSKFLRGVKVENYVNITFYIGGQKVDIAIIKNGRKGPHELLKEKSGV